MKRVGVAELRDQLSRYLRAVEAGAEIEVTRRHRLIARLIPTRPLARVTVQAPAKPFRSIRNRSYRPAGWATSSTDLLLDERQGR